MNRHKRTERPQASPASRRKVRRVLKAIRERYNIARAFTKPDFFRICEAEGIRFIDPVSVPNARMPFEFPDVLGFCITPESGLTMIYLRCFWQRRFRLDIALHELGHYLLGHTTASPEAKASYRLRGAIYDTHESEADLFSEMALSGSDAVTLVPKGREVRA